MLFITKFCKFFVLLAHLNNVNGACPYAQQFFDVSSQDIDLHSIYDDYMSVSSYNTYATDCHQFVSQPPAIPDAIIDHAFNSSIDQTDRYISLDIASSMVASTSKIANDMDRNNFYFESATKYIQQTTCSSKKTTTLHLQTLEVERFKSYMNEDITKVACDAGHVKYPVCLSGNVYRSLDGTCNNLERPRDGQARDCMLRLLESDYKDGVSEFRTSIDGSPLPNARLLSMDLLGGDDHRPLSREFSEFHAFLGEFVISDNGMTLNHNNGMRVAVPSCDHKNTRRANHPQCAGIQISPNDTIRQTYPDQSCMPFVRTIPCFRCRLGPRMISNSVTAAQDLNSVYGVSTDMSNARRTMFGGLLKSQIISGHEIFAVERANTTDRLRCFEGVCELSPFDVRNVQIAPAQMLALLFHRNHNRHARNLAKVQPLWNDEQLFQEARRWNIAEFEHCIFNEYLITLLGRALTDEFGILPNPLGQFSSYKSNAPLRTVIEFQTTAGRSGHAALTEDINIIDPQTGKESKINLRDAESIENIFYKGDVDGAFLAQISKPAFETTPSVPFKTFLLNIPGRTFGLDLAAVDIHRQRDHGIPGYIQYIKYCHNVKINRWDDLLQFMASQNIAKLKKYYKYVEDIDLYVGGLFETKIPDALVSPTFARIIAIQFHNVKYADRFFYEHGNQIGSFSVEQLNEIKTKSSLASILCKTTKLQKVSRDPLRLISAANSFVQCSEFADIDYKLEGGNGKSNRSSVLQFFRKMFSSIKSNL